jgi:hypothetical protein
MKSLAVGREAARALLALGAVIVWGGVCLFLVG